MKSEAGQLVAHAKTETFKRIGEHKIVTHLFMQSNRCNIYCGLLEKGC